MTQETISLSRVLFVDNNSYKLWVTLLCAYYLTMYICNSLLSIHNVLLWFVINIGIGIILDILYYFFNINYYDPSEAIARGYGVSTFFNDTLHSKGIDYGFNFYDGNYNKSPKIAQFDKFKYAIKQLNIKKGDKVIDIGCGCGDWLYYLQTEMKCEVIGINITKSQAIECKSRGLNVYNIDWKKIKNNEELVKLLYNKFDVVTFWDTVEHYVAMGNGLNKRPQRAIVYQNMFKLAHNLLSKNGNNRIWISCLHMRKQVFSYKYLFSPVKFKDNIRKILYIYILDKFHSGFYPSYYYENNIFHDELVDNASVSGFNLLHRKDVTLDYYMTSIINPTHFGRHRFNITFKRFFALILLYFIDPYWIHRIVWFFQESWMLQFDPNDIKDSDTILWWLVFDKSKNACY